MVAIFRSSVIPCVPKAPSFQSSIVHRYAYAAVVLATVLFGGLHASGADAFAIYTVGGDAACNFSDVQAAVNAAGANPGEDYVWIANNKTYSNEQISITGQDVIVEGGFTSCSDFTIGTNDMTTLNGASGGGPVFSIGGTANVYLGNLTITGAHRSNAEGGGIFYAGSGSLTLSDVTITGNSATYGAGVDVSPSGATTLTLMSNTLIIANKADSSGGGIRIEGDTQLIAVSDQTDIAYNTATTGYGGGIEVLGPARADIGSPGYGLQGIVNNNAAAYGGGIAVIANQDGGNEAFVQLFTTDAEHPVNLQGNSGTIEGGALYVKPFDSAFNGDSDAEVCAYNFRIDGNTAPEGAAIYLDFDTAFNEENEGGFAVLNTSDPTGLNCGPDKPSDFGAVACAADAPCNELSGNETLDAQSNPNDGAILFSASEAAFYGEGITIHGNQAGHAMHGVGDSSSDGGDAFFSLYASLIADNSFSAEAIFGESAGVTLNNCTIAHDDILASHVINIDSDSFLTLHDDIIAEADTLALEQPGGAQLDVHYVLSNDISTLPVSVNVISQDPMFVNPSAGNYHLQAYLQNGRLTASRAIDFAPLSESNYDDVTYDINGIPYGQDVPLVPNAYGTRDLGAFEAQPITDRIFGDGFGDPVSLLLAN